MFSEPSALVFLSTLATEVVIAIALGAYLISDVRRKQNF